jgi:hypothetical protein
MVIPLVDVIFHHLWVAGISAYWYKCCVVENQTKIDPMHTTFYAPKKAFKTFMA